MFPRDKTDFGRRGFSSAAPQICNYHIPAAIRVSPSLDSFKRHLKTHYFASPPSNYRALRTEIFKTLMRCQFKKNLLYIFQIRYNLMNA